MRQRIGNGPKFRVQRTRKCGGRKWWEGDECLAEWYSDPVHHPTGAAQHHVKCLGRSWAVPAYTLDVVFYSFCFNGICHNPSQSQYNHNSHTYQATIGSSTVGVVFTTFLVSWLGLISLRENCREKKSLQPNHWLNPQFLVGSPHAFEAAKCWWPMAPWGPQTSWQGKTKRPSVGRIDSRRGEAFPKVGEWVHLSITQ